MHNDVDFDIGDNTLIVADNKNSEQENLTAIDNVATPVDSSTLSGEYVHFTI